MSPPVDPPPVQSCLTLQNSIAAAVTYLFADKGYDDGHFNPQAIKRSSKGQFHPHTSRLRGTERM